MSNIFSIVYCIGWIIGCITSYFDIKKMDSYFIVKSDYKYYTMVYVMILFIWPLQIFTNIINFFYGPKK